MRRLAAAIICVLIFVGMAYATHRHIDRTAQPVRELSKMMAVSTTVSGALSRFYEEHQSYPRSLSDLNPQNLPWGDEGSTPADVALWSYVSEGSGFTMTWTNSRGVEIYRRGIRGQFFHSRGEGP